MKKYFILFILFLVFSFNAVTQTAAPEITQIVVNETGGATVFWTPNTSVNDFEYSEVWYQQIYIPEFFKISGSESLFDTSYCYKYDEAQANSRLTSYYVANYNSNMDTLHSEVVSAIYLTACFTVERFQLSWNYMHPLWTNHAFHIYRLSDKDNTWEFIDSTYNTSFQDDPMPGFSYSYKVYYKNPADSTASVSNITPPISHVERQPVTPSITSIEILPDGTTAIEWEKSPTINVADYIIYIRKTTTIGWDELGRTGSPDILKWIDQRTTLDNCEEMRTYAIAAVDACGETGTNYPDSCKNTLVLYPPKYEICDDEVKLMWERYEGMTVDRYEILLSDDDGENFVQYAILSNDVTAYSYKDLKTGNYCFKVSAVKERGNGEKPQTITSCQYCMYIYVPQETKPAFFRFVSVIGADIQICFEVNATDINSRYQIERSSSGIDGPYEVIETLTPTGASLICTVDSDKQLKVLSRSYHYLLNTLDSCGKAYPAEKIAQSILLTAKEDENTYANLKWNDYEGFKTELDRYVITRYINDEFDREYIVPFGTTSFTDTDPRLSNRGFLFSYRITAISLPSFDNKRDTAFSNIAPLKRLKSDVWLPNAFTPAGRSNTIFRPIYGNEIEVETYEFTIFNRYGAVIFQTTEPRGGWDGRINGSIAASGGYGYMLKIKTKSGDRIERRGSMLLVN